MKQADAQATLTAVANHQPTPGLDRRLASARHWPAGRAQPKAISEELRTTRDVPPVTWATQPEADALAGGRAASG